MHHDITYTTLSVLQSEIKDAIDAALPLPRWITAEIGEIKVNYSGHCYLELVEKGDDSKGSPTAKASAVIWRSHHAMVSSYFRTVTGRDLSAGMGVLVKVLVSYHQLYGLSLQITDIDPSYTLGDIARQRRETIERLKADGVFDMNREIDLPLVMQRIAVVSSRSAAGYQDFMNELGASGFAFRAELFDAFMQGEYTESSVIDALERIADSGVEYDCVVLIRGGGAQSDLSYFDSYDLCFYLAQFPIPVFTGIGHDKDESVADLVAARSFKTPTAVAGFLVSEIAGFDDVLAEMMSQTVALAENKLDRDANLLDNRAMQLGQMSQRMVYGFRSALEEMSHVLYGAAQRRLSGERNRQALFGEFLCRLPRAVVPRSRALLDAMQRNIGEAAASRLSVLGRELDLLGRSVEASAPERIMERGFVVMRNAGQLVRSVNDISAGSSVFVELKDGRAGARIEKVEKIKRTI